MKENRQQIKWQKKNEQALINLIETDAAAIYRVAYSYVRDEHTAYDVIQDSLQKALKKFQQSDLIDPMKPWFFKILMNTAIDYWRKNQNHQTLDIAALSEAELAKDSGLSKTDRLQLITALASLEQPYKAIIILKFFEGFKLSEIAIILDMNENTVKTNLYRGLNQLKEVLIAEGVY